MILYNMRYRGPMEYDKFILNILQYSNEINTLLQKEFTTENGTAFIDVKSKVEAIYNQIVGTYNDNPSKAIKGISENLFYKMLEYKEC